MNVLLDLFAGELGWTMGFLKRGGWRAIAVDLKEPKRIPTGCEFILCNVEELAVMGGQIVRDVWTHYQPICRPNFIVASSPCEKFSVHGMKHFHPNPPSPDDGIRLFNRTRQTCEASGVPYVMENVRAAQQFVGPAVHHCGPFYLWGNAVPPLMPQGISKGTLYGRSRQERRLIDPYYKTGSRSKARRDLTAQIATIPPELANCVAEYAERLLEQRAVLECKP